MMVEDHNCKASSVVVVTYLLHGVTAAVNSEDPSIFPPFSSLFNSRVGIETTAYFGLLSGAHHCPRFSILRSSEEPIQIFVFVFVCLFWVWVG